MDDYILPKEISKIDLSLIDTIDDETIVINAKNGNLEIVDLLIKKGLDIHINNNDALRKSAANGHLQIVKLLLENGADFSANNNEALMLQNY